MLALAAWAAVACTPAEAPPRAPSRPFAIAFPYAHDNLDPHGDGTLRTHMAPSFNVYEPLVDVDHDLKLRPGLARTWATLDDRTWQFELREARFHSGRPVTAADVVASLQRAARPESDTSYYLQDLETVRATGPLRVELRTRGPAPRLLNRLGFVMIVPGDATDLAHRADGTGPYAVERWDPGKLVLRRNEHWWGAKPHVERAAFHFGIDGPRAEAGVLDGTFEVAQFVGGFRPARLVASAAHRLVEQEDFYVTYLAWNHTRPPFSDSRVRRAFAVAVDRRQLAAALPRRAQPTAQLVSRLVFGFDPALDVPPGDPARARALLATAGHPAGIAVTLTVRDRYRAVADALAAELAKAGIRLAVEVEPDRRYFDRLNRREMTLWLDNWGCTTGDAAEFFENALHSRQPGGSFGRFNETGYANREVDQSIAEVTRLEGDERRDALQRMMRVVMEDDVLLPLYSDLDVYGLSRGQAWRPRADNSLRLVDF
jgi:peptide/nickel transport system substrate-binding protein